MLHKIEVSERKKAKFTFVSNEINSALRKYNSGLNGKIPEYHPIYGLFFHYILY